MVRRTFPDMPKIIGTLLLLTGWVAVQPANAAATGTIKVVSINNLNTIGFLQLTGAQDHYILGSATSANTFSLPTPVSSLFTLTDTDAPASHPFLAGLISPGIELLTTNSNAAVLGDSSVQTAPGSTPQSGGSPSIPGSEFESAIWSVGGLPQTLTASWVNHDGGQPTITLVWDPVGQTIYLTANPAAVILNHPGSQAVTLQFVGAIPPSLTPTSTVLTSNLNPSFTSSPNNSVILTATVTSSGSPVTTGSVTFQDGASAISGYSAINVNATTGSLNARPALQQREATNLRRFIVALPHLPQAAVPLPRRWITISCRRRSARRSA